jgi:hypothetical protein
MTGGNPLFTDKKEGRHILLDPVYRVIPDVFHTKVSLVPFPTILGEGEGISIL